MEKDSFTYFNDFLDLKSGKKMKNNFTEDHLYEIYINLKNILTMDVNVDLEDESSCENSDNEYIYDSDSLNKYLVLVNDYKLIIRILENCPDDKINLHEIEDIKTNIEYFCNRILKSDKKLTEEQIINICHYLFSNKEFTYLNLFLNKYKNLNIMDTLTNNLNEINNEIELHKFLQENGNYLIKRTNLLNSIKSSSIQNSIEQENIIKLLIENLSRDELLSLLNEFMIEIAFDLIIDKLNNISESEIKKWLYKYIDKNISLLNKNVLWMLKKKEINFDNDSILLLKDEINKFNLDFFKTKEQYEIINCVAKFYCDKILDILLKKYKINYYINTIN